MSTCHHKRLENGWVVNFCPWVFQQSPITIWFTFSQEYIENFQLTGEFYFQKLLLILLKMRWAFVVVICLPPVNSQITIFILFRDVGATNCFLETPWRLSSHSMHSFVGMLEGRKKNFWLTGLQPPHRPGLCLLLTFQASPCHGSTELAAPPSLLCSQPELSISCCRQLRYDYELTSNEDLQQPARQGDCFLNLISVLGNWTCWQINGLPFCSCFEPLLESYVPKCLNGIGTTWNTQHSFFVLPEC